MVTLWLQARPLELQAIGSSLAPQVPASAQRIQARQAVFETFQFGATVELRAHLPALRKARLLPQTVVYLQTTLLKGA